MAVDVQAWVGHLLVVGGRAVRVPPPGALAESAPKRAARVREGDTFFILVTAEAEARVSAAVFQEMAQLGADIYFGSSGTITSGLRDVLTALHQTLLDQPAERPALHALALVLRGEDLYAARCGRTFAALRQGDSLTCFPGQRSDPLVMNLPPLGSGPAPELQLGRFNVAPGQTLLIADASLIDSDDEALLTALNGSTIPAVLDQIKTLAAVQTAVSVLCFAAPGAPDPGGSLPQPGPRPPRAPLSRSSKPAAPAPVPASPAAIPAPVPPVVHPPAPAAAASAVPSVPPIPVVTTAPPAQIEKTAEPPIPDRPAALEAPAAPSTPLVIEKLPDAATPVAEPAIVPPFSLDEPPPPPGSSVPFVPETPEDEAESEPAVPRGPSALERARIAARRTLRDALRMTLAALIGAVDFLTRTLNNLLPQPGQDGKQGIPTNVAVAMAILIPVVIVVVVLGLTLSGYDRSDFETYLERAQAAHNEAKKLSGENCQNVAVRPLWTEALRLAELAADYRPNDPNVLTIKADAQNYLDCYDNVTRRDLTLLHEFSKDADLVGPVVHDGVDLYVLDRKRSAVYHDTLTPAGNSLTTRDDNPIIRRDQAVGPYAVGDLFDIEWLVSGGTVHDNVLVAIDRSGILVAYSPTFFTSAQQLIIDGRWLNPAAIAIFRSNLYVLDTGANQIWRYVPPAGVDAYNAAPEEYFNSGVLPDLSQAVDFGISDQGAVFVIFKDGVVRQYRRNIQGIAEELPFNYNNNPPGSFSSGTGLFVYNDPAAASLLLLDTTNQTIYETTWAGRYQAGYRARNLPEVFGDLRGIYADAVERNNVYVIAGNKLYHFNRN
jgi:hypothetical protein